MAKKPTQKEKKSNRDSRTWANKLSPRRLWSERARKPKNLKKLPNSFKLFSSTLRFSKANLGLFIGLAGIYFVARFLIVGIPNQTTYELIREYAVTVLSGGEQAFLGTFSLLFGAFGGIFTPTLDGLQQFIVLLLAILTWLSVIYATRQIMAGNPIRLREVLYNAPAPLLSLATVLFFGILQLIPGAIGILLVSFSVTGSLQGLEAMLLAVPGLLLIGLSVYWIIQTVLASVVVTLPNTFPVAAMRSAKPLVAFRRVGIIRKLIGLAFCLVLVWSVILLPVVLVDLYLNPLALTIVPFVAELLGAISLVLSSLYIYLIYRELI